MFFDHLDRAFSPVRLFTYGSLHFGSTSLSSRTLYTMGVLSPVWSISWIWYAYLDRLLEVLEIMSAFDSLCLYRFVDLGVIISMMVLCNDMVVTEYDRRRTGLPSAPLDMECDNSSIECRPLNMHVPLIAPEHRLRRHLRTDSRIGLSPCCGALAAGEPVKGGWVVRIFRFKRS